MSDPIKYYVMVGEEQKGPYTLAQLQTMWKAGSLTVDTQYWFEGQGEWMPLGTILELLEPPERSRADRLTSPHQHSEFGVRAGHSSCHSLFRVSVRCIEAGLDAASFGFAALSSAIFFLSSPASSRT